MINASRVLVSMLTMLACSQVFAAADEKLDYFVFLVTGKSTQGTAQEDIQKMQAAHLENFGRLAKINELSAAGPCADPDKKVRGIVVIHANSIADAESKFSPDPYVSEGFMKTEIHQYQKVAGKFVIPADATQLEKSVIVIVSSDEKWPTDDAQQQSVRDKLSSFAKEQFKAGKIGFAGVFNQKANNQSPRVAVMIFRGEDIEAVSKLMGDLQPVKDKVMRVQVFAQYLVKDAMPTE
ncbi:MAG: hypothetical protein SFV81_02455 [Pirellulaceae bacterium]|nr:hypothetical protein [Pirellulaceae bacterium]